MGLKGLIERIAAGAPEPVFAVAGHGGRAALRRLALADGIELVDTPRAASVLLIAGRVPAAMWGPVQQVHDQLAGPRHTVVWGSDPFPPLPEAAVIPLGSDPVPILRRRAEGAGEAHALADVDPNPWRGVGPYGQGGKGMTGGTPYGRPLTGRARDRDGLELDQLPLAVGPFFPALPPGLVMHVRLQGDVVQEARVGDNPFAPAWDDGELSAMESFERALFEPVPIAELEVARARHHLWWLGDSLALHGLAAMGERSWRLAADLGRDPGVLPRAATEFDRLRRAVGRSRVLRWSVGGVGPIERSLLVGRSLGPVARAGGHHEDARDLDPGYRALGFQAVVAEPVDGATADVAGRWRQRLAEIAQSLTLAESAGDTRTTSVGTVESPRGPIGVGGDPPSSGLLGLVSDAVAGLEWGDAMATIASLDLDMEEAARPVRVAVRR